MGRTAGRTSEDTRRTALDAAATVLRTKGMQATLDDIAREAGMSKGGLVYHFPSKNELIRALATDLVQQFRDQVHACLDPADRAPGRLTRAYIRACFATPADTQTQRETMSLMAQLITIPEVTVVVNADACRWGKELGDDGLPAAIRALVIAAADGASLTPFWGGKPAESEHAGLQDLLVSLTRHPHRLPL